MNSCLQNRLLHAELHWKTESKTVVAVQLVAWDCSALRKSIGTKNFQTACYLYFNYDSRTALLHVSLSRIGGFSSHFRGFCKLE